MSALKVCCWLLCCRLLYILFPTEIIHLNDPFFPLRLKNLPIMLNIQRLFNQFQRISSQTYTYNLMVLTDRKRQIKRTKMLEYCLLIMLLPHNDTWKKCLWKTKERGDGILKKNPQQQQSRFLLSAVRATLRVDEMEAILHGISGGGGGGQS